MTLSWQASSKMEATLQKVDIIWYDLVPFVAKYDRQISGQLQYHIHNRLVHGSQVHSTSQKWYYLYQGLPNLHNQWVPHCICHTLGLFVFYQVLKYIFASYWNLLLNCEVKLYHSDWTQHLALLHFYNPLKFYNWVKLIHLNFSTRNRQALILLRMTSKVLLS